MAHVRPPADETDGADEGESGGWSPRRTGLAALLIAAAILAVFNSKGLTSYTRDLAEAQAGRPLFAAAERWDHAMRQIGATDLMTNVHALVQDAKAARWTDIASLFDRPWRSPGKAKTMVGMVGPDAGGTIGAQADAQTPQNAAMAGGPSFR